MPPVNSPGSRTRTALSWLVTLKRGPISTLPSRDPGLEPVERTRRRATDALADEVVDTTVAGADEVAGGLDVTDRAAEVGAAGRDRDELVVALALELARSLAHVRGRLADLADAERLGEDDGPVVVGGEVVYRLRPPPSAPQRE